MRRGGVRVSESPRTPRSKQRKRWLVGIGNVFLGIAIGLLGYGLVTDLVARINQNSLRGQLPAAAASNAPSGAGYDWSGWATQDRAYWDKLAPGGVFGRLVIGSMPLDTVVVKGATRETLKKGPGWIEWSTYPGPVGTAGISGHRVTWLHPFRNLDRVKVGDTIDFYSPYRVYRYRVRKVYTVTPDRGDVGMGKEAPLLVLTALTGVFAVAASW
ncbi:MAG: sortase, partial [Actinobacteria bacterium]